MVRKFSRSNLLFLQLAEYNSPYSPISRCFARYLSFLDDKRKRLNLAISGSIIVSVR